jgi:hypothetical protein
VKKVVFLFFVFFSVSTAEAAYLDLAWDLNRETDLAGYRVYYGRSSGEYINSVDVGNTPAYRMSGLLDGVTYYIALTAYDTVGNESDFSQEVSAMGVTDEPPLSDPDTDGDRMPDDWEISYFGDLGQEPDSDYDGDGANNMAEYRYGTDPTDPDSDSDRIPDGWEVQYGLDPLDASDANVDSDGDGATNLEEYLAGSDPWNPPPPNNPNPDQTVIEGLTVTLDSSISSNLDNSSAVWLWEQTGGFPVTLSDPTAPNPTFVTPPIDVDGTLLSFRLTVWDNVGLQGSEEISVSIEDNGITGFPDDVITTTATTGEDFGVKVESGGSLVSLETIDPSSITDTQNKPQKTPYGMVGIQIKTDTTGGTAVVRFYLSGSAPHRSKWHKYDPKTGWKNYSRYAVFNSARDQVSVTVIDGGIGDDDSVADGVIIDPSGLETDPAVDTGETGSDPLIGVDETPSSAVSGGGGGCFIRAAISPSPIPD